MEYSRVQSAREMYWQPNEMTREEVIQVYLLLLRLLGHERVVHLCMSPPAHTGGVQTRGKLAQLSMLLCMEMAAQNRWQHTEPEALLTRVGAM